MRDAIEESLLLRYVTNESPPRERAEVEQWLRGSPDRAAHIASLRRIARAVAVEMPAMDRSAVWRRLSQRIAAESLNSRPASTGRIGTNGGAFGSRWPRSMGEGVRFPRWSQALTAAGVAGMIAACTMFAFARHSTAFRSAHEYVTRPGEHLTVNLVDGTRITLAPASRLRVSEAYARGVRETTLEGQAFFEVVHNAAHPFRVATRRVDATDLGTAFSVRAYEGDSSVEVAVAQGQVAVRALAIDSSPEARLAAGDIGTVLPHGRIALSHRDDLNPTLAWTKGELVFHDTPVRDVVPVLERWYGVAIRVEDPSLGGKVLTATWTTGDAAEAISDIAAAFGETWSRENGAIVLQARKPTSPSK
jgi:transmembrane sensor